MESKLTGMSGMKLAIATPFYTVSGFSPYISSVVRTITFLNKHTDIEVDYWELSGDSYIDSARNTISYNVLNNDCTDLFFIDSDQKWGVQDFMKVLLSPGDIVGAGYPCKNNWDFFSCVLNTHDDGRPKVNEHGLLDGHIVPTGFMHIKRSVFERLAAHTKTYPVSGGKQMHDFFGRMPPLGEDGSFNMRCEAIGIKRWVCPDVNVGHLGVKLYEGNYHQHLMGLPGGATGPSLEG